MRALQAWRSRGLIALTEASQQLSQLLGGAARSARGGREHYERVPATVLMSAPSTAPPAYAPTHPPLLLLSSPALALALP